MVFGLTEMKEGVYWVGAVDWNIRSFHGYITNRGTTYNAYLLVDDKITLVDTVKSPFFLEMLDRIRKIVDPSEVDFLISNHTEPDHSGAIRAFLAVAENAELIASEPGLKELKRYYGEDLKCTTITEKPSIDIGNRTLRFMPVPMVHWPDSMVTYVPEDKLLFSNDAFGQHLATSKRFDDEVDQAILFQEAKTYYANIVMHLWRPIGKALAALGGAEIGMIAPSHGVIWRSGPGKIIETYSRWVEGVSEPKVVIVYDTMWGSTERIANALLEGVASEGIEVKMHRLSSSHNSEVITDVLDARAVLIGSPTLNNGLFPSVASFLTYLKGLRPRQKVGAFFGSHGWGGGAKQEAEALIQASGLELVESDLDFNLRPNESELRKAVDFGKKISTKISGNP
ncbi:MAG: FprA family A-type flavoprotein [Candidatus Bathyarchaeota archaeon]|nr:MAG: FprA family A-type flavoprotein [Candidatus Bathyarchaeota archaeon]